MNTQRAYYSESIRAFLHEAGDSIVGKITAHHSQDLLHTQSSAWRFQIKLLKEQLANLDSGHIFFEFVIPRMARRADVVVVIGDVIFVIEFKVGSDQYSSQDIRQVESYALDLKNFHSASHDRPIVPLLIATSATASDSIDAFGNSNDVRSPIRTNGSNLALILDSLATGCVSTTTMSALAWANAPYRPTPTIVEAAQALYAQHSVYDIARSDAEAENLGITTDALRDVITSSRLTGRKSICFVTGVPGAGKTLVGLNLATSSPPQQHAVFLSGNGPLVDVLREALAQDEFSRNPEPGRDNARRKVKSFVQNIHHFRDDALADPAAPIERVVVFDEAQRAWDQHHTSKFMLSKRNQEAWDLSEPDFLIQIMDRHQDWCVIVALVGGGQEINSGEIGLRGWFDAIQHHYKDWNVYYSDALTLPDYAGENIDFSVLPNSVCKSLSELHLSTSMRSFRAKKLSTMVHHLIAGNSKNAHGAFAEFHMRFPIRVTRDMSHARQWIRDHARGEDTKGILASSGAIRLKPHGINVKHKISAPHWFLKEPEDIRSCHFLEDAATEFDVQGLELDWGLVAWDGDLRFVNGTFQHWDFRGTTWNRRHSPESKRFLENAYRVLLTRSRQGMVIFVPNGDTSDFTRNAAFYDGTYEYLLACGIPALGNEKGQDA
ncbi:MAG: FIG01059588: hypothetical protein [uncultured Chloroflexia bacterium]|uniref:AAA+ ATPase domain-containing protein n=1 Tax=uncultured Chloroflexia bacterium TaxID=1672391 RepID=A0A6J4MG32_9CHLR|nr:MAG: FIG01059588: hypothetical protein [uncultured Chloroflexia bacterium]